MWMLPFLLRLPYASLTFVSWILRRFHGGHTLLQCQKTVESLGRWGLAATLDYCVENAGDQSHYSLHLAQLHESLELARKNAVSMPFIVFKLSAFASMELLERMGQKEAEQQDVGDVDFWAKLQQDLRELCQKAAASQVKVLVDAEESWIQGAIDAVAEDLMELFNTGSQPTVYHTVQMYRKDRWQYLQELQQRFRKKNRLLGIKLVRGAYLEKERQHAAKLALPSAVYDTKEHTDQAFNRAMIFCLEHRKDIFTYLGTHNEQSIEMLLRHLGKHKISSTQPCLWFAQLLGMGDHISYWLAAHKYNTSKYIPYGPASSMVPYLLRRAQENSSLEGHGKREYAMLRQEWQMRKKA